MGEILVMLFLGLIIYLPLIFGIVLSLFSKSRVTETARRRASIMAGLGILCILLDISAHGFEPLRLLWPLLLVFLAIADLQRYRREKR